MPPVRGSWKGMGLPGRDLCLKSGAAFCLLQGGADARGSQPQDAWDEVRLGCACGALVLLWEGPAGQHSESFVRGGEHFLKSRCAVSASARCCRACRLAQTEGIARWQGTYPPAARSLAEGCGDGQQVA